MSTVIAALPVVPSAAARDLAEEARVPMHQEVAIQLRLLGHPCVVLGNGDAPLSPTRPTQLLAYLAVRKTWQRRDDVARLFWPDSTSKAAYSNLRSLLCRVAAAAPFAPIESPAHALRLNVASDLDELRATVQRGDPESLVRIGMADLLPGFEHDATEPYVRWLESEREALVQQWKAAVQSLLARGTKPVEQREALAQHWALRCPHDEDAVRARLLLAREQGQLRAAQAIYEEFQARLKDEFGVNPSRELQRFARDTAQAFIPNGATASMLPGQATAPNHARPRLFGRRLEMQQLRSLLLDSAERLVTLTGPGGVGKTTLLAALHANLLDEGRRDAHLVDASAVRGAQGVIAAIASALGIEGLHGPGNAAGLAATLRDRPCLLVIDGAEQDGLAAPFTLLLERCPNTRILLAARRRLHADIEHVQVLDGFPLPDTGETDIDVLGANDAVGYFLELMRRAGRPASPAHDAATVAELVHALEGLPLALSLLAPLTHVYSLRQLLDIVRAHVAGQAAPDSPDVDELMPALMGSFQRSWGELSPVEQAALARLAVFPASFDVTAARAVAATQLPVINSLIDRSLLRAHGTSRLSLHASIRACVRKVSPRGDEAEAAYLEFYTRRLVELAEIARHKSVRPVRDFLREEAAHVEHAWQLALEQRNYSALLRLAESLINHTDETWASYGAWFGHAEPIVRHDAGAPNSLKALLLAGDALFMREIGKFDIAKSRAREALRMGQLARHREAMSYAMAALAFACVATGQVREAQALLDRHQALCRDHCGETFRVDELSLRAILSNISGDFDSAMRAQDQVIDICRRFEDSNVVVLAILNQSEICSIAGDSSRAALLADQAVDEAEAPDVHADVKAYALMHAANAQLDVGQPGQARACIDRAVAIARDHPLSLIHHCRLQIALAAVAVAERDLPLASQDLAAVLETIGRGELQHLTDRALVVAAKWFHQAGDRQACIESLCAIVTGKYTVRPPSAAQKMLRELGEAQPEPGAAILGAPKTAIEVATATRLRILALVESGSGGLRATHQA